MIRVLIVDDELSARSALRSLLSTDTEIALIGECCDGAHAIATISSLRPDLVFLDVKMPRLSGFDVIEAIGMDNMPALLMTCSRPDEISGCEARSLKYLSKPVEETQFREGLRYVKTLVRSESSPAAPAPHNDVSAPSQPLTVKAEGKLIFLRPGEIEWIEASANYLVLHAVEGASYTIRGTMNSFASQLDPAIFLRIHRSTIVNVNCIREIKPWHAGHMVLLRSGQVLQFSRTYHGNLRNIAGRSYVKGDASSHNRSQTPVD